MGKITKCPWGSFEVLSEAPDHKVKRIVVEPGGILSLQRHKQRSEHWFVVSGKGIASVDGKDYTVQQGGAVDIITNILGYNTDQLGQIRVVKTETILN